MSDLLLLLFVLCRLQQRLKKINLFSCCCCRKRIYFNPGLVSGVARGPSEDIRETHANQHQRQVFPRLTFTFTQQHVLFANVR